MRFSLFLAALFLSLTAYAELAPSAYEKMQAKANDYVHLEVLRVDVEPGQDPAQQKVHVVAMVTQVTRSASGLKPDDIVNILYTVTDRPQGWAGPGEIPLLADKMQTIAYLNKQDTGDYAPAAGRMSFSNF